MTCITAHAAGSYLFVGSYNWDHSQKGLYVLRFDTLTGALTPVSSVSGFSNPGFFTLSANGHMLYACTGARMPGEAAITSFSFDPAIGKLSLVNSMPTGGSNPVYIAMHSSGHWLAAADYNEGYVMIIPVSDTGVGHPRQVWRFHDSSVNKERQEKAHIHAAVFAPLMDRLFLPDLGGDGLHDLVFNASADSPLHPAMQGFVAMPPGSGPRHMVFHPNGRYAYCVEELGGSITSFTYHNGNLDRLQRVPLHLPASRKVFACADIHISPDGRFLYASNRGDENNIAILSVDTLTGKLKLLHLQSARGQHPRNFTIDPSGHFLLVANQFTGNIVVFKRDRETGMLSFTGTEVKAAGASCLVIKNYNE